MKISTMNQQMTTPIIPTECRPVTKKNSPPSGVSDHLGKDQRRWHMWGRVCDRLEEEGSRGVVAKDLIYEGWITEQQAHAFLAFLQLSGIIRADGYADVGMGRKIVRLTVYRSAS